MRVYRAIALGVATGLALEPFAAAHEREQPHTIHEDYTGYGLSQPADSVGINGTSSFSGSVVRFNEIDDPTSAALPIIVLRAPSHRSGPQKSST